ncbi:hypothetical protein [Nonomuraea diastatica]|uniref:hypothetical protein n=1 Tax=Nonomuraea diastatica TaxID=1848329 RepID=UPI001C6FFBE5|nr:hypothetical protein [Nonomuraea diastatica]
MAEWPVEHPCHPLGHRVVARSYEVEQGERAPAPPGAVALLGGALRLAGEAAAFLVLTSDGGQARQNAVKVQQPSRLSGVVRDPPGLGAGFGGNPSARRGVRAGPGDVGRGDGGTQERQAAAGSPADTRFFDRMIVKGYRPRLALLVEIEEVFYHCSKSFLRSSLWKPETWTPDAAPSRARIAKSLERPDEELEDLEVYYGPQYGRRLYG